MFVLSKLLLSLSYTVVQFSVCHLAPVCDPLGYDIIEMGLLLKVFNSSMQQSQLQMDTFQPKSVKVEIKLQQDMNHGFLAYKTMTIIYI